MRKKRIERPNVGGVAISSKNGSHSRKVRAGPAVKLTINIPCSSHEIRTIGSSMLLKTLLESANQPAHAQPRVIVLQSRFQRSETSRPFIVRDSVKVKPLFIQKTIAAQFPNLCLFICRHMVTLVLLPQNMPPSAPTKQRWLRTSVPRAFENTSTRKWCLSIQTLWVKIDSLCCTFC